MYDIKKKLKKFKVLKDLNRVVYRMGLRRKFRKPILDMLQGLGVLKIVERNDLISKSDYKAYPFSSVEHIHLDKAYCLEDLPDDVKLKLAATDAALSQPYVFEVPNATLRGTYATGFDQQGRFIRETGFPYFIQNIDWHTEGNVGIRSLLLNAVMPSTHIEVACSLVNEWNNNYFHWLTVSLTKLEALEHYYYMTGVRPQLIINSNPTKWQMDSLRLMGYTNWIEWNQSKMTVGKLIVPSIRKMYVEKHGVYRYSSPGAAKMVAAKMLAKIEKRGEYTPFVYISRAKATGRQVVNEVEVIEVLAERGFKAYILEDMSFEEQAVLFGQAKYLIAPHGAGLINMAYASNLKVIELCGPTLPTYSFAEMARARGFKYACLTSCIPVGDGRTWDGNMNIDTSKLLELMNLMEV